MCYAATFLLYTMRSKDCPYVSVYGGGEQTNPPLGLPRFVLRFPAWVSQTIPSNPTSWCQLGTCPIQTFGMRQYET
jgi:hypothetical protein